jgi:hypothetical protein
VCYIRAAVQLLHCTAPHRCETMVESCLQDPNRQYTVTRRLHRFSFFLVKKWSKITDLHHRAGDMLRVTEIAHSKVV